MRYIGQCCGRRFWRSRLVYLVALALGLTVAPIAVRGQFVGPDPSPPTGIGAFVPAALAPGAPAGSYPLKDFDHINFSNLHVSIFIPVAPAMGRGAAKVPVGVSLDKGQILFPTLSTQLTGCTSPSNCTYTTTYDVGYGWD